MTINKSFLRLKILILSRSRTAPICRRIFFPSSSISQLLRLERSLCQWRRKTILKHCGRQGDDLQKKTRSGKIFRPRRQPVLPQLRLQDRTPGHGQTPGTVFTKLHFHQILQMGLLSQSVTLNCAGKMFQGKPLQLSGPIHQLRKNEVLQKCYM